MSPTDTPTRGPTQRTISVVARLVATGVVGAALASHAARGGVLLAGRWTPAYAVTMLAVVGAGVVLTARAWRNQAPDRGTVVRIADAAGFIWAIAYGLGTFVGNEPGSRLFAFRLFGSIQPAAAVLEWIAMILVTIAGLMAIAPVLRGRWRDVTLAVGSVLVAALLAEGAFRIYTLARPTTHGYNTYSNELWYRRYDHRNSLGFRDLEPTLAPTAGRRRIVLIGDSFAFGNGVDRLGDRFGEQLASRLREHEGGDWEILNASRGNTNTLQQFGMLSRVLPYKPELVVLLYVFNDADYLKPRVNRAAAALPSTDFRLSRSPIAVMMKNSYLFQELYLRLQIASYRERQREANIDDAYADSALVTKHLADMARFMDSVRTSGARFRIVPFDIGVVADERLRARDERFIARALAAGLPLCPITRAFDGHAFRSLTVNALDLHPNEYANRLAAEAAWPCVARALASDTIPRRVR